MKRFRLSMNRTLMALLAAALAIHPLAQPLSAASRPAAKQSAPKPLKGKEAKARAELEARLRGHIVELASDAYQGREPGTDGETKTLRYIGRQWFDIGLQSGTNNPLHPWFAPVEIVGRDPSVSRAFFTRKGKRIYVPDGAMLVLTSGKRSLVENAPVLFAGKGNQLPPQAELAGKVVLLLDGGIEDSRRQDALLKGGALAVITVLDGERSLGTVAAYRKRTAYALASDKPVSELEAFLSVDGLNAVLAGTGLDVAKLQGEAAMAGFTPRLIDLGVSLEATTRETRIRTHNIIGKLPGKRPEAGAVLVLAHWDHFGQCAEPPAEDLICNGAVDNASGLAVMTEIARRLADGPQLDRDVYFLATTAEEIGFLGVRAFAENPPLPLGRIVAAFNIDTVALAPAGRPFEIVGKGLTPLDPQIEAYAKFAKRRIAPGNAAAPYAHRQDGWALLKYGVPAVMVSSSWSDISLVEAFMESDYHRPGDKISRGLVLGGAADDVEFHVGLVRWFADPRRVPERGK